MRVLFLLPHLKCPTLPRFPDTSPLSHLHSSPPPQLFIFGQTVPIDRHPEVKNALNAMYTKYTQKKRSPQEKQELLRHMLCIFRQISYWETKGLFKKPPQQLPWCKPSVVIDGQELVDVDAEDDVQEVDCVVLQEEHGYLDVDAEADMLPPGPALKPKAEPSE